MIENIDGVTVSEETLSHEIKVTRVEVASEQAAAALGKSVGNYITIAFPRDIDTQEVYDALTYAVRDELYKIMKLTPTDKVLAIGIGNKNILVDSFGPRTVERIEATSHLSEHGHEVPRAVSCLCPGVTGQTGIETFRIVRSVVEEIKPDCIIVIDSLCSPELKRLATTIQISDAGISPGSGIGRTAQSKIDRESMGVPVIAIGLPTVIGSTDIIASWFDVLGLDWIETEVCKVMERIPNNNELLALKDTELVLDTLSDVVADAINQLLLESDAA